MEDEVLSRMIQETIDLLPGKSIDEASSPDELEQYFRGRLGSAAVSSLCFRNTSPSKFFFRFACNEKILDFPKNFGPFVNLAQEKNKDITISRANDADGLMGPLLLLFPNALTVTLRSHPECECELIFNVASKERAA